MRDVGGGGIFQVTVRYEAGVAHDDTRLLKHGLDVLNHIACLGRESQGNLLGKPAVRDDGADKQGLLTATDAELHAGFIVCV